MGKRPITTVTETDPRGILALLAVVEHGSFRAAARALVVPKSTLSQRVADLEERLGVVLLARTTRSVQLTDVGRRYHDDVAPAFEALRAAEARVAERQVRPSGHLRVTAPFELGQRVFGPVLAAYTARCPDVRVTVDLVDRQVSLVEEGYDLAVRVGPLDESGLIARRVGGVQRLGLYASRGYLRKHGRPSRPRDLDGHQCLVMSGARRPTTWTFAQGNKKLHKTVTPTHAANSFIVLTELAVAGAGIARLPARFVHRSRLVEVLADYAPPGRQCFAVYPSRRHVSPALREMLDVLAEIFVDEPWSAPPRAVSK